MRRNRTIPVISLHPEDESFPLQLGVGRMTRDSYPVHSHDFTELVIVFGGHARHVMGIHRYPIGAGDVFVVRGDLSHGFADLRQLEILNLMFDPAGMGLAETELATLPGYQMLFHLEPAFRERHTFRSRLRLPPTALGVVRRHTDRMQGEFDARRPGYRPLLRAWLQELLVLLARVAENSAPGTNPPREELLRLGQTIAYLERHFREPLRLPDLARRAGMSANSFLRAFRQVRGFSPIEYRLRLQLHHAAGLLLAAAAPGVGEAAAAAGFSDSNYFSRQFRGHLGCAPREFRRQPDAAFRREALLRSASHLKAAG
jgi:AraC-like DNA-binding protein